MTEEQIKGVDAVDTRRYIAAMLHVRPEEVSDDAVYQLTDAFMPAIGIMVERGQLRGELWRQSGWRGALYEARKKLERLWRSWWTGDRTDQDSALDLLNFTGFFIRASMEQREPEWGVYGEPGSPVG